MSPNEYTTSSPILFLVFARPAQTLRVFEQIRKTKPAKLYLACDGPRTEVAGEVELVNEVRSIISEVDWKCKVTTFFRDTNVGCGRAVSEAITWFFENETEGIILEDDCLPKNSFFHFCDELLEKYRDDDRIASISGSYSLPTQIPANDESYFLARYGRIWGWASWRRAWQGYDREIKFWPRVKELQSHRCFFECKAHTYHYQRIWDKVYRGEIDTWDYQWDLKRLIDLRFTLVSTSNLIENIGFDKNATHTSLDGSTPRRPATNIQFPLKHPSPLLLDYRRDKETHTHRYGSKFIQWVKMLKQHILPTNNNTEN